VIKKIHAAEATSPIPDFNDKADALRTWFKTIVPDHDEDKVHINDIRKLLKWYTALKTYVWEEINEGPATETDSSAGEL
jgi:tRNA-dihydrouridine synthase